MLWARQELFSEGLLGQRKARGPAGRDRLVECGSTGHGAWLRPVTRGHQSGRVSVGISPMCGQLAIRLLNGTF